MIEFSKNDKLLIKKALKRLNIRVKNFYEMETYSGAIWWYKSDFVIKTKHFTIHSCGDIISNYTGEVLNWNGIQELRLTNFKENEHINIIYYLTHCKDAIFKHIKENCNARKKY